MDEDQQIINSIIVYSMHKLLTEEKLVFIA